MQIPISPLAVFTLHVCATVVSFPVLQIFFTDKYKEQYPNYTELTTELKEQMAALVSLCGRVWARCVLY